MARTAGPKAARTVKSAAGDAASAADAGPEFAALARIFAADRRVTAGKLFASYGLKVHGRIFAMIVRGDLVVKLPKARVDELVQAGVATRFDPGHGRLMKESAHPTPPPAPDESLTPGA